MPSGTEIAGRSVAGGVQVCPDPRMLPSSNDILRPAWVFGRDNWEGIQEQRRLLGVFLNDPRAPVSRKGA